MLVKLSDGRLAIAKPARGKNGRLTISFEEVKPNVCDHWYPTEAVIRRFWIFLMSIASCQTCFKAGSEDCDWCERH